MATVDIATRSGVDAASPLDHPYLLTINRYYGLIRAGGFSEGDPVYLWKGRLIKKMTMHPSHASTLARLNT